MIRRSTLALVIVFVVFAAFALYWQRSGKNNDDQAPTSTPRVTLFDIVPDTIQSIRVQDALGEETRYDEQEDGSWVLMVDPPQTAKPEEVVQAINQMVGSSALNTLEPPPSDDAIGLQPYAYRIEMQAEGGRTLEIEVGATTATGSGYYVRTGGKVYVVSKSIIDTVIALLNTPPILTPAPTITPAVEATATP